MAKLFTMNSPTQARLFGEKDLPLFSGTPVPVRAERFAPDPIPTATQVEMFDPGEDVEGDLTDCPEVLKVTLTHKGGSKPTICKLMTTQHYLDHYYTLLGYTHRVETVRKGAK